MSGAPRSCGPHLLIVLVAGALALSATSSPSITVDASQQRDLAADVDAFAATLAAADQFSGSVLLERHGQPLVRRGYGLADRERRRPNTPGTPFMLSSVGKTFTAVAI